MTEANLEPPELSRQPRPEPRVELESVRDVASFAALRTEWGMLHERSDSGPFTTWEWLYPWFQRLGEGRRLMILTARDGDGMLVGLMPLCLQERRAAGLRAQRLCWLGEAGVGSDYLDVIAAPEDRERVTRTFLESIYRARGQWDVLDLLDVDQDSVLCGLSREVFGEVEVGERFTCPYEPITPGESFDAFLRRTGRRENFQRRQRWLERQPGFAVEIATEPGALTRPFADLLHLHHLRWAPEGGSQGIRGPEVESFHRDATQYLAERGRLRLFTLQVLGKTVAAVYGIVDHGRFSYYQAGYDPAWRSKSVGLVLVGETFLRAMKEGLTGYDFLRGTEAYKSDWTTQERKTVSLRVCAPTIAASAFVRQEALVRGAKGAVKKVLPARWTERARRAIRRR
jgi:CelD/BcsL family acetyltransferase involved in cellulose biosynthesis